MSDKIVPRRKLSVFQRSFDIDTVFETTQDDIITENHILSEHPTTVINSCSLPQDNLINNTTMNDSTSNNLISINCLKKDNNNEATSVVTSEKIILSPSKINYLFEKKNLDDGNDNKITIKTDDICHEQINIKNCYDNKQGLKTENLSLIKNTDNIYGNDDDSKFLNDNNRKKSLDTFKSFESMSGLDIAGSSDCDSSINTEFNVSENNNNNNNIKESYKIKKITRSLSIEEKIDCTNKKNEEIYCCACKSKSFQEENKKLIDFEKNKESQVTASPIITDELLQRSGIIDNIDVVDLSEDELERKYIAFSIGLFTDRETLSRRREISIRQRDQTENNFVSEMFKMQNNIQALAPLCLDSETVEKIERARNQIEILLKCAQRVSCAAETVGAIQQEYRLLRAVYLTDKYLKVMRNRCNKYSSDLAESKRILSENNIIINENNGESSEELSSALRYRGLPNSTNRTMIARRRASIATIFRPFGTCQEISKDSVSQRDFLPGRITIRRPSFSSQAQMLEAESLKRTESSDSVGELREIFEQAESRRVSIEENNNLIRTQDWERDNTEVFSNIKNQQSVKLISNNQQQQQSAKDSRSQRAKQIFVSTLSYFFTWRLIILYIAIAFVFCFYVRYAMSSDCNSTYARPIFKWWSIEEIIDSHVGIRKIPRPV